MKMPNAVLICCALGAVLLTTSATAQNAAAPISDFYRPYYRGQSGTESAFWSNSFTVASGGPNYAPINAPGGAAWANASITQQTNAAVISDGGIYTGGAIGAFVLNYSISNPTTFSNGVANVLFQTETSGYQLDYSSVTLLYTNASGVQSVSPAAQEQFYYTGTPGVGGAHSADVIAQWQWNLPANSGVTNFAITFNGAATHVDLGRAMLDVASVPGAGPFAMQSTPPDVAQWMYPFAPPQFSTAPLFSAFGYTGAFGEDPNGFYFDTRDGQYLVGWNTSNGIPAGQGITNYLIRSVRVTLTISADMQWPFDGTLRDYRTYFLTNDSRYVPSPVDNSPVELYGAGFRGGFTNSNSVYVAYASTNYPQDGNGPFYADPNNPSDFSNRIVFAACYNTNGTLVDVSDNVGDDGTNEEPNPFEVAPFAVGAAAGFTSGQPTPAGTQITFDLNLNDPFIYSYVQQGLNQGNLSFVASSLADGNRDVPNYPAFYTVFNALADTNQYPLLDIQGTVIRSNLDSDRDGLPDDWEQFYFASLGAGATNSSDGDGVNNLTKYIAGVDPTKPATDLQILSVSDSTNGVEIHFTFAPDRQYKILWSDDLKNWNTVANPSLAYTSDWLSKAGTNVTYPAPVYAVWRDTNPTDQQRFYKIGIQ
jgi:hypothetical protein